MKRKFVKIVSPSIQPSVEIYVLVDLYTPLNFGSSVSVLMSTLRRGRKNSICSFKYDYAARQATSQSHQVLIIYEMTKNTGRSTNNWDVNKCLISGEHEQIDYKILCNQSEI